MAGATPAYLRLAELSRSRAGTCLCACLSMRIDLFASKASLAIRFQEIAQGASHTNSTSPRPGRRCSDLTTPLEVAR
jgi:hypothetical protein